MRDARELDPQHNRIAQLTEEVETLRLVIAQGQQLHAADERRIRELEAIPHSCYDLCTVPDCVNKRLRIENAKLKTELDATEIREGRAAKAASDLRIENAKLKAALEKISRVRGSADKVACLAAISECASLAREVLVEVRGGK